MNGHFDLEKQKLIEEETARNSLNDGFNRFNKDDINSLKRKVILQGNIIKSYDSWIHLLINIVNENNKKNLNISRNNASHFDFASSIEKGLEKIEQLAQYNLELKKKYLEELKKKEEQKKVIEKLHNQYAIIKDDIANNNKEVLTKEKQQLLETVNSISEELDYFSDQNNKQEKNLSKNSEMKRLYEEIQFYKNENKQLKQILELKFKEEN